VKQNKKTYILKTTIVKETGISRQFNSIPLIVLTGLL
jgi:hypothetical protein